MEAEEQIRRLAALPPDRTITYSRRYQQQGTWCYAAHWTGDDGRTKSLYLGQDSEGRIARAAQAQRIARPWLNRPWRHRRAGKSKIMKQNHLNMKQVLKV